MHRGRLIWMKLTLLIVLLSPLPTWKTADAAILEALSPREFKSMLDAHPSQDVVLLDIRTPAEFADGHLERAVSIDYYGRDFEERLKALDRQQTYLIYCRSGNRTGRSLAIFEKLGFARVYHLESGLIGWTRENFPLVR